MKIVGTCTDEEILKILEDQYQENSGKSMLHLLTGQDFESFLKDYPIGDSSSKGTP